MASACALNDQFPRWLLNSFIVTGRIGRDLHAVREHGRVRARALRVLGPRPRARLDGGADGHYPCRTRDPAVPTRRRAEPDQHVPPRHHDLHRAHASLLDLHAVGVLPHDPWRAARGGDRGRGELGADLPARRAAAVRRTAGDARRRERAVGVERAAVRPDLPAERLDAHGHGRPHRFPGSLHARRPGRDGRPVAGNAPDRRRVPARPALLHARAGRRRAQVGSSAGAASPGPVVRAPSSTRATTRVSSTAPGSIVAAVPAATLAARPPAAGRGLGEQDVVPAPAAEHPPRPDSPEDGGVEREGESDPALVDDRAPALA